MSQAESRSAKKARRSGGSGRNSTRRRGFTLLEVLAAVAILGIWYMVAATIAMQGLRAEGQSQRRLRASLIADEIVADLESDFALSNPPPAQDEETERGEYTIRVEVEPYELTLPGSSATPNEPTPALSKLVAQGGNSLLSEVRVEVRWFDGVDEKSVVRETFGLDLTPALAALEAATPRAPVENPSEDESAETEEPEISLPAGNETS